MIFFSSIHILHISKTKGVEYFRERNWYKVVFPLDSGSTKINFLTFYSIILIISNILNNYFRIVYNDFLYFIITIYNFYKSIYVHNNISIKCHYLRDITQNKISIDKYDEFDNKNNFSCIIQKYFTKNFKLIMVNTRFSRPFRKD